jgi:hypothetical protein
MVDEHGENWPRYIHERSPWRCDRQDNNHKTALLFSNFDQLKAHWKTDHGGNTPAAYERELGDLEADVLSRNETGVVLLMLRKEQKEAGVLSETKYVHEDTCT